jgi:hypothetical protein
MMEAQDETNGNTVARCLSDNLKVKSNSQPDQSTPDIPLSKFTLFMKLPQELRLKIWRHTFEPRKIVIRVESDASFCPNAHYQHPIALQICSESREEALKWYKVYFHGSDYPTYVNSLIDMPHIRHGSPDRKILSVQPVFGGFAARFLKNLKIVFDGKFMQELRYLAIDRDLWTQRIGRASLAMRIFPRLERLVIVIDDDLLQDENEWSDIETSDDEEDFAYRASWTGNYHSRMERRYYTIQRWKMGTSAWNYARFRQTEKSQRYAEYVKDDVLQSLCNNTDGEVAVRVPEVKVVVESASISEQEPPTWDSFDLEGVAGLFSRWDAFFQS